MVFLTFTSNLAVFSQPLGGKAFEAISLALRIEVFLPLNTL